MDKNKKDKKPEMPRDSNPQWLGNDLPEYLANDLRKDIVGLQDPDIEPTDLLYGITGFGRKAIGRTVGRKLPSMMINHTQKRKTEQLMKINKIFKDAGWELPVKNPTPTNKTINEQLMDVLEAIKANQQTLPEAIRSQIWDTFKLGKYFIPTRNEIRNAVSGGNNIFSTNENNSSKK